MMSHKEWSLLKKQPTPIEDLFINITKEKKDNKVVSHIYKCLNMLMSGSALDIKGKWELGMNVRHAGKVCVRRGIKQAIVQCGKNSTGNYEIF